MQQDQFVEDHAPSGLAAAPALRWGSHVGHFFRSGDELHDVLVPYFKAGLENNECCLWVTGSPFRAAEARAALRGAVPDFDRRERGGQIEIMDGDAFYDPEQPLQSDEVVGGLLQREQQALRDGFQGVRTNGNCGWVGEREWGEFQYYERLVSRRIRGRRLICMCSYHAGRLRTPQMIDVVERHDLVLGRAAPRAGEAAADPDGQYMAELGHDLRNPIAAIMVGAKLLEGKTLDDKARAIVDNIGRSAERMATLVDNITDQARGRIAAVSGEELEAELRHAIAELSIAYPGRVIEAELAIAHGVNADEGAIARVLSNLVTNALKYGDADAPVRVMVSSGADFVLSVSNRGPVIGDEVKARLFEPFTRGDVRADQQGQGLGLHIVAEIARAHGGVIEFKSGGEGTRFTFRMPL